MNILLELNKSHITGPPECLQACMTSLEPLQVLVYPFLDMSSPHLCDCLKMTRQSSNPVTLRGIKPDREFTPALTQGMEDNFPIHNTGTTAPREVELSSCIWSINWFICVKVLSSWSVHIL